MLGRVSSVFLYKLRPRQRAIPSRLSRLDSSDRFPGKLSRRAATSRHSWSADKSRDSGHSNDRKRAAPFATGSAALALPLVRRGRLTRTLDASKVVGPQIALQTRCNVTVGRIEGNGMDPGVSIIIGVLCLLVSQVGLPLIQRKRWSQIFQAARFGGLQQPLLVRTLAIVGMCLVLWASLTALTG